jgi:hypothetical protein
MKDILITKLGKTRSGERSRVWIEGERLTTFGFKAGSHYVREWDLPERTIRLRKITAAAAAKLPQAFKVSGRAERPVIDITGNQVSSLFKTARVKVQFERGLIVISEEE